MAKSSETLKEMRECGAAHLVKDRGLDTVTADDYAKVFMTGVQERFKGGAVYIGTGFAERISERDWEIWDKFNGKNQEELGRRYGITGRQVYKIIETIRPLAIDKVQGDLFG